MKKIKTIKKGEKMKNGKVTEICYANNITVNRGNYENEKPFWSAKTILQGECDENTEFARLKAIIDPIATKAYKDAKIDLNGLRIRLKDNKRYPSVTSIIQPDPIVGIKNLEQYALRGSYFHERFNAYIGSIKTEVLQPDISPLKFEDIKFGEFMERFLSKIGKPIELNKEVFNGKHMYSGEIDYLGAVDNKLTLADIKTGSWKVEQLSAYAECLEVEQVCIFDLKTPTIHFISKDALNDGWESFLKLRGAVLNRFGI